MPSLRVLPAVAALALALSSAQAHQGVSLASGFTDFRSWSLQGDAAAFVDLPGNGFRYSRLVLTSPGQGGQAGAGFAPTALALDFDQAFHFDFHFFIPVSPDLRGDGFSFTLAAAPGLGGGGSGLGYQGLGASVALAVDTFHFDGEAVSPSLQLLAGGDIMPLASTETGLGDAIRDPDYQWLATLDYTPTGGQAGWLTGRISHLNLGSFEVAAAVDFQALGLAGAPVYYGFTAGNGLASDGHIITSAAPVPEPASWGLMLAGLFGVAALTRRRLA